MGWIGRVDRASARSSEALISHTPCLAQKLLFDERVAALART